METLNPRPLLSLSLSTDIRDTNWFNGCQRPKLFALPNSDHCNRGHCYKLQANHLRVDVCKFFFAERVVPIWNSLTATASLRTLRNLLAITDHSYVLVSII